MTPQKWYDTFSQLLIPEEILKENGYLFFENEIATRAQFNKNNKWSAFMFMPDTDPTRKCTRCSRLFNRKSTFAYPKLCQYHPLKTEDINGIKHHLCCFKRVGTSKGCQSYPFHVHSQPSESVLEKFVLAPKPVSSRDYRSNKVFGLDVEMVHTENGLEAGRISLVDCQWRILIDEFIKPEGRIIHLNTQFSGIEMNHLDNAKTLKQIHKLLFQFINKSSIIVGHGLSNDFKALQLVHLKVIDTGLIVTTDNGKMMSLKRLAKKLLDVDIQARDGGHDSIEDAMTCLKIAEKLVNMY